MNFKKFTTDMFVRLAKANAGMLNTVLKHESWLQQLDYRITELEKKHVGFEREIPEPQVALSQQYMMDRLSEVENTVDDNWLNNYGVPQEEINQLNESVDKILGSWGHKDPDGDDDVRGLA